MTTIAETLDVARSNLYEEKEARPSRHNLTETRRYYKKAEDAFFVPLIRKIVDARPTYGYRRVTALLSRYLEERGNPRVNHKRVYRIMKINRLLLQRYTGKPTRTHDGTITTRTSNLRWCSDIFEIPCWNSERIRIAFSLDCCDREVMSYIATTGGINGAMIQDLVAEAVESRFGFVDHLPHTIEWLSDNGSAYTARDTRAFAESLGLSLCTTPVRSPESNGMAEAFVKTFKRDYVHVNPRPDAHSVLEQLPGWFEDYNEYHPHKGLNMKSPRQYRRSINKLDECPI
jgi:putative transposase